MAKAACTSLLRAQNFAHIVNGCRQATIPEYEAQTIKQGAGCTEA